MKYCLECGAVNFRESDIEGVCVECNPAGGTDDRKYSGQILVRNHSGSAEYDEDGFV